MVPVLGFECYIAKNEIWSGSTIDQHTNFRLWLANFAKGSFFQKTCLVLYLVKNFLLQNVIWLGCSTTSP